MHLHTVLKQGTNAFNLQLQMHYYGFDISNIKLWILIFEIIKLALNLAAQVSASQRGPARTTPADIYLQQQNMSSFYKKFTRRTRLFGQWKKFRTSIVCSVVFIYTTRDELSRHLCSALFMSSHLCWGTWLFPWPPPLTGSWSPQCHLIKKNQRIPPAYMVALSWVMDVSKTN